MVNFTEVYHRDFCQDFPLQPQKEEAAQEEISWDTCQRIVVAALPLLGLHKPWRGPLTLVMSGLRTYMYGEKAIKNFNEGHIAEAGFQLLHATLAVATIGLLFFNPLLAFFTTGLSDFIINAREFVLNLSHGNFEGALKNSAFMAMSILLLIAFYNGGLEIIIVCILLKIFIDFYQSLNHFISGRYIEGSCQALLGYGHIFNGAITIKNSP